MKFGREFHHYTVPQWASTYIHYAQLKQDYKTALRRSQDDHCRPDFAPFFTTFNNCLDELHEFHRRQYDLCLHEYQDICILFGIEPSLTDPIVLVNTNPSELALLSQGISRLRQHLTELERHLRVNEIAVSRICTKIVDTGNAASEAAYTSRWTQLQLRCGKRYPILSERLSSLDAAVRENVKSLASASVSNVPDPQSLSRKLELDINISDLLISSIVNDNGNELYQSFQDHVVNNKALQKQAESIVGHLLNTAFLFSSERCALTLMSLTKPNGARFVTTAHLLDLVKVYGWSISSSPSVAYKKMAKRCVNPTRHSLLVQTFEYLSSSDSIDPYALDRSGRSLLHYIAEYDLVPVFVVLSGLCTQSLWDSRTFAESLLLPDSVKLSPLHYAVISNNLETIKLFTTILKSIDSVLYTSHSQEIFTDALFIAMSNGYDEIVQYLISAGVGTRNQNTRGETALYLAAKLERHDYVQLLLKMPDVGHVVDLADNAHGWSPIFMACINGDLPIVSSLLNAGASCENLDLRGWSVAEHAAYRGHLELASILQKRTPTYKADLRRVLSRPRAPNDGCSKKSLSHVIINLGSVQKHKVTDPVKLLEFKDNSFLTSTPASGLLLEMYVRGTSYKRRFRLPLIGDLVNDPFIARCELSAHLQLVFNLYSTASMHDLEGILIGSGMIPIVQGHQLDQKREGLMREHTASIMGRETLDCIATVTVTIVISKPYDKLQTPLNGDHNFGQSSTQIIGHRGFGQNLKDSYLQLGENTLQSFISAAAVGASWVEFDLQMTRDLVPVLYHDFSLSESGTDVPIHDVSLKQFLYAGMIQASGGRTPPMTPPGTVTVNEIVAAAKRLRANSLNTDERLDILALQDRMQNTYDYTDKGFKPNTRGRFIQEPFATLEDVLTRLPDHINLDIEVKYPRIHETLDADVAPVGIDINLFVDRTLDTLHRFGGNRQIILSSFSPETCILMKLKQRRYPVMFISNVGKPPDKDKEIRTASIQAAVHFSRYWGFEAVCFESMALVHTPRLVGYTKSMGLGCTSYGPLNNVPEYAKIQAEAGLDMIVADRVGLISKVLNGSGA